MPDTQSRHHQLPHSADCLVCGRTNPHGLKLDCFIDEASGVVRAFYAPGEYHCGFAGVVHGGMLATVLDEAMTWAATWQGKRFCFAGEITVRFKRSAQAHEPLEVYAAVTTARSRLICVSGRLTDASGEVVASSEGKYVPLSAADHQKFVATLLQSPATMGTLNILRQG